MRQPREGFARIGYRGHACGHIGLGSDLIKLKEEIHLKKLLAAMVAGAFAFASIGAFAASHTGAQPAKDDKKGEMKKDDKKKDDKKAADKK